MMATSRRCSAAFDRLRIVFTDGVFDAEASDDLDLDGVRIESLADAAAQDLHWARDVYGTLEARGQSRCRARLPRSTPRRRATAS